MSIFLIDINIFKLFKQEFSEKKEIPAFFFLKLKRAFNINVLYVYIKWMYKLE